MNKNDPNALFKSTYDSFIQFKQGIEAKRKFREDPRWKFDKKYNTRLKNIDHNIKSVPAVNEEHLTED